MTIWLPEPAEASPHPTPDPSADPTPASPTDPAGRRTTGRGWLLAVPAVLAVLAPVTLAAAAWPAWWAWIAREQSPMTWLQSVTLVLAAGGCALLGWLAPRFAAHLTGTDAPAGARSTWLLLGAGFGGLALDERFALHERVRDGYLAPRGVSVPFLPWVAPGDFLVLLVAVAGLAFLPRVVRAFTGDRLALGTLIAGVGLAVVAVGLDSVDPATWTLAAERLEQTLEECIELASGLALLAAVVLRLTGLVAAALPLGRPDAPAA